MESSGGSGVLMYLSRLWLGCPPPPGVANVTQDYDDFHSVRTEAGRVRNKSTKEDRDLIEKKKKKHVISIASDHDLDVIRSGCCGVVWCGVVRM